MPSTLMGQFMEALNSQTNLDDLNLNIDSFQGGLECNVDEVILSFNFQSNHSLILFFPFFSCAKTKKFHLAHSTRTEY